MKMISVNSIPLKVGTLLLTAIFSQSVFANLNNASVDQKYRIAQSVNSNLLAVKKSTLQKNTIKRVQRLKAKNISQRQKNQKKRIRQGIRSGELTIKETKSLRKQQKNIQQKKRRFKSDGLFAKRERARIHKKQNRSSKRIYRLKHNNRKRK